jgi:hypothetical protein
MDRQIGKRMPIGIVSVDDVLLDVVTPLIAVGGLAERERRLESRARSA